MKFSVDVSIVEVMRYISFEIVLTRGFELEARWEVAYISFESRKRLTS